MSEVRRSHAGNGLKSSVGLITGQANNRSRARKRSIFGITNESGEYARPANFTTRNLEERGLVTFFFFCFCPFRKNHRSCNPGFGCNLSDLKGEFLSARTPTSYPVGPAGRDVLQKKLRGSFVRNSRPGRKSIDTRGFRVGSQRKMLFVV